MCSRHHAVPRARSLRRAAIAALSLAVCAAAPAAASPTGSASAFHDSVGINIHNNHMDTAYAQWERAMEALRVLGLRHVRDGLKARRQAPGHVVMDEQAYRLRFLEPLGIRVQFILGAHRRLEDEGEVSDLLRFVRTRLRHLTDGLEGPNEYDIAGDPQWAPRLRAWQQEIFRQANADPVLRTLPVVGPSLVHHHNRAALGDLSAFVDEGNTHPYPGGNTPGGDHLRNEMAQALRTTPGRRLQATEVGYHNLVTDGGGQGVSERAAAAYVPRIFLEHFSAGISRTYLFQLLDEFPDPKRNNSQQHFGLVRNTYSVKPAYTTLARLLAWTRDDVGGARRKATPAPALAGDTDGVRRLDLVRRDGTRLVALWQDGSVFDRSRRELTMPALKRVRVVSSAPPAEHGILPLDPALSPSTVRGRPMVEVGVGAVPVIVSLSAARGGTPRLPEAVAALSARPVIARKR